MTPGLRVVLRADASSTIGAGHVMRSLALGAAVRAAGGEAILATASDQPGLIAHASRAGIATTRIAASHPDAGDAAVVARLLDGAGEPWAVVDGYHFDVSYFAALRARGLRTLAIDDEPRLASYPVDRLVDQNLGALRQPYAVPDGCALLGPRFCLLRPEFASPAPVRHPAERRTLLITMGGGDGPNLTTRALRSAVAANPRLDVVALIGAANPHREALVNEFGGVAGVRLVHNALHARAVMAEADLAISAVGGTMWELASLGVPTLLVSATEVQRAVATAVAAYGAHRWVGDAASLDVPALSAAVDALAGDPSAQAEMSRLGRALIDGRGASRVAALLTPDAPGWTVRPATTDDVEPIWEITTEASVRAQSFRHETFSFGRHEAWWRERHASGGSRFWVAERGGAVMGFVRYDHDHARASANFAVCPAARGQGMGARLLADTWRAACEALGVTSAEGVVFVENTASRHSFRRAGFIESSTEEIHGRPCVRFLRSVECVMG